MTLLIMMLPAILLTIGLLVGVLVILTLLVAIKIISKEKFIKYFRTSLIITLSMIILILLYGIITFSSSVETNNTSTSLLNKI